MTKRLLLPFVILMIAGALLAFTFREVKEAKEVEAVKELVLKTYVNGAFNDLNPDAMRNLVKEFHQVSPRNSRLKITWEIYLLCRRIDALDELHDEANRRRHRVLDRPQLERAVAAGKGRIAASRTLRGLRRARSQALRSVRGLPLASRPAAALPGSHCPLAASLAGRE